MADVNLNSFHIRTLLRIRPGVSMLLYTMVDANESPSGLNESCHNPTLCDCEDLLY